MTANNGSDAPEYEPLAQSVRRLIDATIRTEAGAGTVAAAKTHIDCAVEQLSESLMPGSFGVRDPVDGQPVTSGNVISAHATRSLLR